MEEEFKKIDEFLEISNSKKSIILDNILMYSLKNKIDVSPDVYKDTLVDKWIESLPVLEGSKILINKIIHNPINDINILKERQEAYIDYADIDLAILKEYENDILWTFVLNKEINEDYSINLLYPSNFIICYINYIEPVLDLYHLLKIYASPLLSVLYPISILYGPLYYLNKVFKLNISITKYIEYIYQFSNIYFQSTGNTKMDMIKIVTFIIYILIYIYNIYQTFEMAYMLHKTKEKLTNKMKGLVYFVKESINIINSLPLNILKAYINDIDIIGFESLKLTNSMTDIYRLWKDNDIKDKIKSLLNVIYMIDIINTVSRLRDNENWCLVNYTNDTTKMWGMKNPLLNNNQISNPIDLSKNIIITGPNAAGKTTYVKSILSNIILAHTFGITNCLKSNIVLYDTINSFMRITDILGAKSYFEVETEYCSTMINKAIDLTNKNKKGLFLMDEPMHSTPPTEGMSTAYAVAEFIGNLPGINLIITTHFHKLVILESNYPNKFINLSVEAIKQEDNTFYFPYKINRGFSYQCIAIELLEKQKFPQNIINSAIEMKNKLCSEFYSK